MKKEYDRLLPGPERLNKQVGASAGRAAITDFLRIPDLSKLEVRLLSGEPKGAQ